MRSSAVRLTCSAAAVTVALVGSVLIIRSEQQLSHRRTNVRAFDVIAREGSAALSGLRASQQAYVAPGQGLGFWRSTVDALLESAASRIRELEHLAGNPASRSSLTESAAAVENLRGIDKRVRQYLNTDQPLMAADVIFSEAGDAAATAGRQIELARQAEYLAWDAEEAATRAQQVYTAAGAAAFCLIAIGFLTLLSPVTPPVTKSVHRSQPVEPPVSSPSRVELQAAPAGPPQVSSDLPREIVPVLKATVDLCTDLNRVRDVDDLTRLLGRAAQVMDASGLVVWIASPGASSLRPVLAHGYSPQALARMPPVPRSADNAAAAAFRTGSLQIVLTRPGISSGALAAPMLASNGCIGALTAEIKNGSETSDGIQALAAIVASQLAGVLADSVLETAEDEAPESRIASA
jgi:hypothetical protein